MTSYVPTYARTPSVTLCMQLPTSEHPPSPLTSYCGYLRQNPVLPSDFLYAATHARTPALPTDVICNYLRQNPVLSSDALYVSTHVRTPALPSDVICSYSRQNPVLPSDALYVATHVRYNGGLPRNVPHVGPAVVTGHCVIAVGPPLAPRLPVHGALGPRHLQAKTN